jgi:seryl-tRNA synthetase
MMYHAVALAMVLPLMDLHCDNKKCTTKIDELTKSTEAVKKSTDAITKELKDSTKDSVAKKVKELHDHKAKLEKLPSDTEDELKKIQDQLDDSVADSVAKRVKEIHDQEKYVRIEVELTNTGQNYTVSALKDTCEDLKTKQTDGYVMCCDYDGTFAAASHVEVDKYTYKEHRSYGMANTICEGKTKSGTEIWKLCNAQQVGKILSAGTTTMSSAGSKIIMAGAATMNIQKGITIATRANSNGKVKVWTNIKCH